MSMERNIFFSLWWNQVAVHRHEIVRDPGLSLAGPHSRCWCCRICGWDWGRCRIPFLLKSRRVTLPDCKTVFPSRLSKMLWSTVSRAAVRYSNTMMESLFAADLQINDSQSDSAVSVLWWKARLVKVNQQLGLGVFSKRAMITRKRNSRFFFLCLSLWNIFFATLITTHYIIFKRSQMSP